MRGKFSRKSSPTVTLDVADIILSRAARADLVEIGEYGDAQFGWAAADAYLLDIERAFGRLADFPQSGEARPTWGHGFRCLVCNRHRIVYRLRGTTVEIFRILHHSRDVPRHLQP
jgi:toxin ParE1/3/4